MARAPRHKNRIELLQGTLDLLVLEQLRWAPSHGYGLSQAIRAHSGDVLRVDAGSLYPALHRLERQGLVRAQWGIRSEERRVGTDCGRCGTESRVCGELWID